MGLTKTDARQLRDARQCIQDGNATLIDALGHLKHVAGRVHARGNDKPEGHKAGKLSSDVMQLERALDSAVAQMLKLEESVNEILKQ